MVRIVPFKFPLRFRFNFLKMIWAYSNICELQEIVDCGENCWDEQTGKMNM